jgi:hypothetical protein
MSLGASPQTIFKLQNVSTTKLLCSFYYYWCLIAEYLQSHQNADERRRWESYTMLSQEIGEGDILRGNRPVIQSSGLDPRNAMWWGKVGAEA